MPGEIARAVLASARPKFLSLSVVSVLVGIAAAAASGASLAAFDCVAALIGAVLAHASVNLLNESHDFRSGLDAMTVRTPFSGGSGSLVAHPDADTAVRVAGWGTLVAAAAVGLYFVHLRGWGLLPVGLAGVLLVVAYTPFITRAPLLCLLAPGIGFGPVMVTGVAFAVSGHYSWISAIASVPPLFLVSELLLVNQFPDVDADRRVGRRNMPIVVGRRRSASLFAVLVALAFAAIAIAASTLPLAVLWALLPLPVALLVVLRVRRHADDVDRLVPWLGVNVAMIHITLLLFAAGLWLG